MNELEELEILENKIASGDFTEEDVKLRKKIIRRQMLSNLENSNGSIDTQNHT